jgi:uncharacterized protein YggE
VSGTKAARNAVHAALSGVASLPARAVVNHEPTPSALPAPIAVTVATDGVTPTDITVAVRVYVQGIDASRAWDSLDDTVDAVEAKLDAGLSACPRGTWAYGWAEEFGCFTATCLLAYPRNDF